MKKNDKNQIDSDQFDYIILKIDYDTKLILPINDGMEFIRIWAKALQLKEPYKKAPILSVIDQEFNFKFISDKTLRIMKASQVLDLEGDNNV